MPMGAVGMMRSAAFQKSISLSLDTQIARQEGTDKAAMKGHAAMPQDKDFDRMLKKESEVVEKYVSQAGAYEKPENKVEIEVIDLSPCHRNTLSADLIDQQQVREGKARYVHHAVPADGKRSDLDNHRVDMRVRDHERITGSRVRGQGSRKTQKIGAWARDMGQGTNKAETVTRHNSRNGFSVTRDP